jgi:hypothetical protein
MASMDSTRIFWTRIVRHAQMHLLVDCPRLSDNRSMLRRDYAISQRDLTERLTENSSVFLQNSHSEDPLRESLVLVLAALLQGQFLESRRNSYLSFLQPRQSLPPRISELRIHSSSLIRVDGRRPSWTRLSGRDRKTVTHKSIQCNLFVTLCKEDHIKKIRTFCGRLSLEVSPS